MTFGAVILSALLYILSLWFPQCCAELIFIFLVPLFLIVLKSHTKLTHQHGFFWGFIFYSFYFLPIFFIFFQESSLSYVTLLLLFFLFIIYCSLFSYSWFFLFNFFKKKLLIQNSFVYLLLFSLLCFSYFYVVSYDLFLIFGVYEGNILQFPLLPLMYRSYWLYGLHWFSPQFLLVSFILGSGFLAYAYYSRIFLLFLPLCYFVFSCGWTINIVHEPAAQFISRIGCIIPNKKLPCAEQAEYLSSEIQSFSARYPFRDILIMPESTFSYCLHHYPEFINLWYYSSGLDEHSYLILGSHRCAEDKLFNTLYVLYKGRIIFTYDKSHLVYFTEFLPDYWSHGWCRKLFLYDKKLFCRGNQNKLLRLPLLPPLCFYLCSELYFDFPSKLEQGEENNKINSKLRKNLITISLINDSWFPSSSIPLLMLLHARFLALYYQRTILYVSYLYSYYISSDATMYDLPTNKNSEILRFFK